MVDGTYNVIESALAQACAGSWPRRRLPYTGWPSGSRPTSPTTLTPTTRSTAPRRPSTRACCAASTRCTTWTTWRCATSTSTARGWTSTASTPRCWCAGWSGSKRAKPPLILGDGSQTMDFVYIGDVARSNLLAAEADASDEVFNVASGTETSLLELAQLLIDVMGSDASVEHGPERAVNKVPRRLSDTTLARERLGFEAEIGLEEGLRLLVDWWRAERTDGRPPRSRQRRERDPDHAAAPRWRRAGGGGRGDRLRLDLAGPARARVRAGVRRARRGRRGCGHHELHDRARARAARLGSRVPETR